ALWAILFAIHVGRMEAGWPLIGLIAPIVAVAGDVVVAVLLALGVLGPARLAVRRATWSLERRGWARLRAGAPRAPPPPVRAPPRGPPAAPRRPPAPPPPRAEPAHMDPLQSDARLAPVRRRARPADGPAAGRGRGGHTAHLGDEVAFQL